MCVPGCMERLLAAPLPGGVFSHAGAGSSPAEAGRVTDAASAHLVRAAVPSFSSILDLTHTLSPDFPVFPGDPTIEVMPYATLNADGYNMNTWRLVEHSGTHLDAPIHFCDDGASVDEIDTAAMIVPLAVVDVATKAQAHSDYLLSRDDLAAWEKQHGPLPRGGCVAMHSGWGRLATTDPTRFIGRDGDGTLHFPGIAPEAATWLLGEREIAGLAVDTLSLDNGPSRDFPTHRIWLPSGRWGLENVANLDRAPATGATLIVGVPKVRGATGAPVRLLALVPA